jgi:DNA-binding transcriptional LysR family regulator
VTFAPTFARLHMVSKLPAFFAAYPDMAVETAASESPTTIIEDGFDLAIHSGDLPDSTLVARRFAQTMIILVATPQYLGVLEHLGMAQAPAWLFAAELSEGTVIRLLTAFERTVPILAVRPASRRLSTKVRIFIEHLEKTFALCSPFNPRLALFDVPVT